MPIIAAAGLGVTAPGEEAGNADDSIEAITYLLKIGADIKPYFILGACNPHFAYKALQQENKIGTMLPCNVLVQQLDNGDIEVSAVDPLASMQAIENPGLAEIANEEARIREDPAARSTALRRRVFGSTGTTGSGGATGS